jgi:hypothetical protein
MLNPIAARINSTIAALPIHMMRISLFSSLSSGRVIASSFFRECDRTFLEDKSTLSRNTPLAAY